MEILVSFKSWIINGCQKLETLNLPKLDFIDTV